MKLAFTLEYDGTDFSGFQSQKNSITIQDHIERAIEKITNTKTRINYSGRTDAGVHALSQVFDFDTEIQNTIIPKKDYGKFEFGIDGLLFCDFGSSADSYKSLTFNQYLIGYGFGLKLFISSTAIGFYFGFNPYNQTHFHVKGNS